MYESALTVKLRDASEIEGPSSAENVSVSVYVPTESPVFGRMLIVATELL